MILKFINFSYLMDYVMLKHFVVFTIAVVFLLVKLMSRQHYTVSEIRLKTLKLILLCLSNNIFPTISQN